MNSRRNGAQTKIPLDSDLHTESQIQIKLGGTMLKSDTSRLDYIQKVKLHRCSTDIEVGRNKRSIASPFSNPNARMSRTLVANLRNAGSQCSVFARFTRSMEAISVQLKERTLSIKPEELINERHVQQHASVISLLQI